jgi:hypothetical protein
MHIGRRHVGDCYGALGSNMGISLQMGYGDVGINDSPVYKRVVICSYCCSVFTCQHLERDSAVHASY